MDSKKYKIFKTQYPTYMQAIFQKSEEITLVHAIINPHAEEEDSYVADLPKNVDEVSETTLDLTGNPLQVDLKGDDDLLDQSTAEKLDNWTEGESRHYPIDPIAARRLFDVINENLSEDVMGGGDNILSPTVFVVYEPIDKHLTYLVGSNASTITRVVSYIRGCKTRTHKDMAPSKMLEAHRNNCEFLTSVTSKATALYRIQGSEMRNSRNSPKQYSSIHLEVSWNTEQYNPSGTNISSTRLKMQVMNGYKDSPFSQFWQQLTALLTFMDICKKGENLDLVTISNEPMYISEIYSEMQSMLMQPSRAMKPKDKEFKNLDLNGPADVELLDKLWGILINCADISDLKESMTMLFEEFARNSITHYKVPENNTTSIGNIIKGICEGVLAVPTITSSLALLYLIELGVQKLKNNYLHIVSYCHSLECKNIISRWNDLSKTASVQVDKGDQRVTMAGSRITAGPRMTRMTFARGAVCQDMSAIAKQVDYLANLHVMVQFIYLAMSNLPPSMTDDLNGSIVKKYSSNKSLTLAQLQSNQLCEIVLDVYDVNLTYLEGLDTVSWNLNMTSSDGESQVTTIFHHSQQPIIPKCIFKDYDISIDSNQEKMYYVTETIVLTH